MISDEERIPSTEPAITELSDGLSKNKGVYSNLRRQLSEDDLNSPGTQRLILAELDKYDECKQELNFYKEAYHRKDKENAVYRQQLYSNKAFDIVYSFLLAVGPAILGLTPMVMTINVVLGWIMIVLGSICLISGVLTKVFAKSSKTLDNNEYSN